MTNEEIYTKIAEAIIVKQAEARKQEVYTKFAEALQVRQLEKQAGLPVGAALKALRPLLSRSGNAVAAGAKGLGAKAVAGSNQLAEILKQLAGNTAAGAKGLAGRAVAGAKPIVDKAVAGAQPIVDKAVAGAKPIVDKAVAGAKPIVDKAVAGAQTAANATVAGGKKILDKLSPEIKLRGKWDPRSLVATTARRNMFSNYKTRISPAKVLGVGGIAGGAFGAGRLSAGDGAAPVATGNSDIWSKILSDKRILAALVGAGLLTAGGLGYAAGSK